MSLSDFAKISEIIAAFGVVASLLYVGYQIRETKIAVRAAAAQARTELGIQLITSRYTSDISVLLVKSLEQPASLNEADRFKLKSFFTAHVRHGQNLYYQDKIGMLDEFFSRGVARTVCYWIRNYPWAKEQWEKSTEATHPDFKGFIDAELQKHVVDN